MLCCCHSHNSYRLTPRQVPQSSGVNLPWAIHLFYRDGEFMINGRDDRSYIIGNTIKFDNFEDAKTSFISKLEHFVESTKKGIKVGFSPYYSSPLWDDAE